METYLAHVEQLSYRFINLLAETLGLPPDAFNKFYDADELMQLRGKVRLYKMTRTTRRTRYRDALVGCQVPSQQWVAHRSRRRSSLRSWLPHIRKRSLRPLT